MGRPAPPPLRPPPGFGEGCRKAGELLRQAGYPIQPLTDAQAFLIDGDEQRVI
ncbi:MAG: hypothetical protein IPK19_22770 [Chloroflexi bacterium]|nr:hypothetical protein [Chloroflexota bacterium]